MPDVPWRITPGFWLVLALLLYLDEGGQLLLPIFTACLCHELGHLLAARLLGLEVRGITLSAMGAELHVSRHCSDLQEGILLFAGPGVNLLLCLGSMRMENAQVFAAVNLLLAWFNLLPVPPLDGGGLAELLLEACFPGRLGWLLCRGLSMICCAVLAVFGAGYTLRGNPSLLSLSLWLTAGVLRQGAEGKGFAFFQKT